MIFGKSDGRIGENSYLCNANKLKATKTMKKIMMTLLVMMMASITMAQSDKANDVMRTLRLANDYFMAKYADPTLPTNVTVPAGETYTFGIDYEGRTESASVGDITATATFTENMTGRILADTTSLTSVRVELTPLVPRSGADHRHILGVGERIVCERFPGAIAWSAHSTGDGALAAEDGVIYFDSPLHAARNVLTLNILDNLHYTPFLDVMEPTGVVALDAWEQVFESEEYGVAGWAGMELELYVLPTNVAFTAIAVVEVPEYGGGIAPTGYFATSEYSSMWHHTVARGAGTWLTVQNDNNVFPKDEAQMGEPLRVLPWCAGRIVWRIPMAWGYLEDESTATYCTNEFGIPYYQYFDIDASGTLRVTKLSYWVQRSPDNGKQASEGVRRAVQ